MMKLFFCLAILLGTLVFGAPVPRGLEPRHVAVLYNGNSPYSKTCALEYARLRGVPETNCVPLLCDSAKEEVSRGEYERTIAEPLRKIVSERRWHLPTMAEGVVEIGVLLLMPDIPLKIAESPRAPGRGWEWTDAASVDSELATFGLEDVPCERAINNPYFNCAEGILMSGWRMTPVCRIQASSREAMGRMIFDPVSVEESGGLWGRMAVDEGGPYREGDGWLRVIARRARSEGIPLLHDVLRATLAPRYPLGEDIAFYFGWYAHHADGPFGTAGTFRFARGAVAVHMHSYSAVTLREPGKNWCGPLLERGAVCTVGNVYEPFLALCTRSDILFDRLAQGFCWAEAAWMATPALSWQNVVLGDPLYRPFAGRMAQRPFLTEDNRYFQTWRAMEQGWGSRVAEMEKKVAFAAKTSGKSIFNEWFACREMEEGCLERALHHLSLARMRNDDPETAVRLCLLKADILMRMGNKKEGWALTSDLLTKTAASPWLDAVKEWHKRFAPPPPPAAPKGIPASPANAAPSPPPEKRAQKNEKR